MKLWINIFLLTILTAKGFALEMAWLHLYGSDRTEECYDHIQTADSGYALVGTKSVFVPQLYDIYLIKTNRNGELEWDRTYGIAHTYEYGYKIFEHIEGGYLIFGITAYTDEDYVRHSDVLVLRVDEDGDSLWSKTYGGEQSEEMGTAIHTNDGGYAIGGSTRSWGSGNYDYYLLKLDENCDSLWMKTYGNAGMEECNDIIQTFDGGYAMTGYGCTRLNNPKVYLSILADENGDSLWSVIATRDRQFFAVSYTIDQINDSTFVMTGGAEGGDNSNNDMWCIAFTRNGFVWNTLFGRDAALCGEIAMTSCKTQDSMLVYSGLFVEGYYEDYYALIKMNYNGEILLSKYWEVDDEVRCYSVLQNFDGCYSLAGLYGHHDERGNTKDFFLLETESDQNDNIVEKQVLQPYSPSMIQAYPNPFNSQTTINIKLPLGLNNNHTLEIYSSAGRLVDRLSYLENTTTTLWSPNLPSGQYIAVIRSDRVIASQKFTLVK